MCVGHMEMVLGETETGGGDFSAPGGGLRSLSAPVVPRVAPFHECLLTVPRRWRSSVTWTWATDHSRCPSGRGRTLCADCDRGSWCGGPDQSRGRPGGPGGCSRRTGHSPHRNWKKKTEEQHRLRSLRPSLLHLGLVKPRAMNQREKSDCCRIGKYVAAGFHTIQGFLQFLPLNI